MSLNYQPEYNRRIHEWILRVKEKAKRLASSPHLQSILCPVCQSSDRDLFVNNDALDYVRCNKCRLVYMNPRPQANEVNEGFKGQDPVLEEYFQIVMEHRSPPSQGRPNPETDPQLRDIYQLKRSGNLLDVGCSFGNFLHKARHFYSVEGVEINPVTAKVAAKDFNVYTDFLDRLDLEARFDIVTLHQILYGVPEPVSLLRDIFKVLKPGGLLYVNTPNADSFAVQLFKGKANHFYGYTSLNVFNRGSLEVAAKLAGFALCSFRTEWLDIYSPDVYEFLRHPELFIHRRNISLSNYEKALHMQDEWNNENLPDLGNRGNYLVAVLKKETGS